MGGACAGHLSCPSVQPPSSSTVACQSLSGTSVTCQSSSSSHHSTSPLQGDVWHRNCFLDEHYFQVLLQVSSPPSLLVRR